MDAALAPGGHNRGSDPLQYRNSAPRCAGQCLLDTAVRCAETLPHLHNEGTVPAAAHCIVHRCVMGQVGMPVDRSHCRTCGRGAADRPSALHGNAARLAAYWLAGRPPILYAAAGFPAVIVRSPVVAFRSPVVAFRSPVVPAPVLACEQTQQQHPAAVCPLAGLRMLSSTIL